MLENCCYQIGQMMIIHENGVVRVTSNGATVLQMTPDEFLDFWYAAGKLANRIVAQNPLEMSWKPDGEIGEDAGYWAGGP